MKTTQILVLRHDPPSTMWMGAALRLRGYEVTEAGLDTDAVEIARGLCPHVVVVTLSPRHAYVRDVLAEIRETEPAIRVVVVCEEGLEGLDDYTLRCLDIDGVMRLEDGPLALDMWIRAAARAWRSRQRDTRRKDAWGALVEIADELRQSGGADDILRSVVSRLDRLMGPELSARFMAHAGAHDAQHRLSAITAESEIGGVLSALTGQALEMQRLRTRMAEDDLTNVLTRETFYKQASAEIQGLARDGGEFALAVFDVDRFKRINDGHGHLVGDRVLCEVADIVRSTLRPSDFVGRFGGDEFLVGLRDTTGEIAMQVLERLRRSIREHVIVNGVPVTISCGVVAVASEPSLRLDAAGAHRVMQHLLGEADRLLYVSKQRGRDAVSGDADIALPRVAQQTPLTAVQRTA